MQHPALSPVSFVHWWESVFIGKLLSSLSPSSCLCCLLLGRGWLLEESDKWTKAQATLLQAQQNFSTQCSSENSFRKSLFGLLVHFRVHISVQIEGDRGNRCPSCLERSHIWNWRFLWTSAVGNFFPVLNQKLSYSCLKYYIVFFIWL